MNKPDHLTTADPPILLAVLIAARRSGNRMLEDIARRQLDDQGIKVSFGKPTRPTKHKPEGGPR